MPPSQLKIKKPAILFLSPRAFIGGAQRVLADYLYGSKLKEKFSFTVLTFEEGPFSRELGQAGFKVKVLPGGKTFLQTRRIKNNFWRWPRALIEALLLFFRLGRYLQQGNFALLFSNGIKSHLLAALWGKILRRPVIIRLHDIISKETFSPLQRQLVRLIFTYSAEEIIVVSQAVRNSLLHLGVPEEKIKVIYNGIKIPPQIRPWPRQKWGLDSQKDLLLGIIGRISFIKGQEEVVRLWPQISQTIPAAKLLIVGSVQKGEENYLQQLQELIQQQKMEKKIIFTGFCSNIYRLIKSLDLVIIPSIKPDPLPTVALEAVALGKYVVATRIGGLPEIIFHPSLGLLYPAGDDDALVATIIKALKERPPFNPQVYRQFQNKFSHRAYLQNLDQILLKYSG